MSKFLSTLIPILISFSLLSACSKSNQGNTGISKNADPVTTLAIADSLNSQSTSAVTQTPTPVLLQDTTQPVIIISLTPSQAAALQDSEIQSSAACTNRAELIKHLNILDNTALDAGQGFAKLWQIKNAGTCIWTLDYTLAFNSGEQMSGQPSIPFSSVVGPGETVDLRVDLVAPLNQTIYTGYWILRDANGIPFGVGAKGNQAISITIQVKPTPMPTSGCVHCARTYD